MEKNTVILTESLYIGKGYHKKVYLHPEIPSLCIKVPFTNDDIDLKRELNYRKILDKQNRKLSILPKYYGPVSTNLGIGYMFEYIRDFNNKNSLSLREFLKDFNSTLHDKEIIVDILLKFKFLYLKELPITSDIDPGNLLVQQTTQNSYCIRIIDNIGSPVFIPLEYYSSYFAKRKVKRYWIKFLNWIKRENPELITPEIVSKLL